MEETPLFTEDYLNKVIETHEAKQKAMRLKEETEFENDYRLCINEILPEFKKRYVDYVEKNGCHTELTLLLKDFPSCKKLMEKELKEQKKHYYDSKIERKLVKEKITFPDSSKMFFRMRIDESYTPSTFFFTFIRIFEK
jgi:hypothetical protein